MFTKDASDTYLACYQPEHVMHQFRYVQTIPRHPHESAFLKTVEGLGQCYVQYPDHILFA